MAAGAGGVKTGPLAQSGFGRVGAAVQDGRRRILVLIGARTEAERARQARRAPQCGFGAGR